MLKNVYVFIGIAETDELNNKETSISRCVFLLSISEMQHQGFC
jgi:hypothetical protein